MTALIRSELLALRTLRSTWYALAGVLALALLIVGASLGDAGEAGMRTPSELREPLLAVGYLTALYLSVLAATASAGEYRHKTISQRFLASPGRRRVIAAKLATYSGVGAAVAGLCLALALAIAAPVVSGKGLSLGLHGRELVHLVAGTLIVTALLGMLGVLLGAAFRNSTTAVTTIFGVLLVEKLFGGLLGAPAQYLPFDLLEATLGLGSGAPWGLAALMLAGLTGAFGLVTDRVFLRRDVT